MPKEMLMPASETKSETTSDRLFAGALTAVYAAWVIFVALHHEPWRDEADAWLAVRDMGPGQLFHWLGPAGTPGLWYLLIMPLAKLGLPYMAMGMLHVGLAIVVVALIAFCSPFSRPIKVLIAFAYAFSYEYSIVRRSYVLTALLLFLLAMVLAARHRRYVALGILLCLLFNTNAHGFFFAAAIAAVVAVEVIRSPQLSRGAIAGAMIAAFGAALALAQILQPTHAHLPSPGRRWPVLGYILCEAFFPHVQHFSNHQFHFPHGRRLLIYAVFLGLRGAGALVVLAALYLIRRSRETLAVVILGGAAIAYLGVFKWYGGERHAGLLFVLILFGIWIAEQRRRQDPPAAEARHGALLHRLSWAALTASLVVACAEGVLWGYRDVRWDYSGSTQAAMYLRDHKLADTPITCIGAAPVEALLPYLPATRVWYPGREEYGTYVNWGREWEADEHMPQEEALRRIRRQFPSGRYVLIVPAERLRSADAGGYQLLFKNSRYIFDHNEETYFIYLHEDTPALHARK